MLTRGYPARYGLNACWSLVAARPIEYFCNLGEKGISRESVAVGSSGNLGMKQIVLGLMGGFAVLIDLSDPDASLFTFRSISPPNCA